MISPKVFARETGMSYAKVRNLAQNDEIKCIISPKGYLSIYESELDRFKNPEKYVLREEYERVLKENAKLKSTLDIIAGIVAKGETHE